MVDTLSQLDVPHIHALQRLADERERIVPKPGSFSFGGSEVWQNEPAPIRAALVRTGAGFMGSNVRLITRAPSEGITGYGLQILEALRAESDAS